MWRTTVARRQCDTTDQPAGWYAALPLRVVALLGASLALEVWLRRATNLPEEGYESAVLALETGRRMLVPAGPIDAVLVVVLAAAAWVVLRHRTTGPTWQDIENGRRLRAVVMVAVGLLTWVYATRSYNFYFDRAYGIDRGLLIAFAAAVWWRPAALIPFLAVLFPLVRQIAHPIGGFSWAPPILLVRVLILMAAFWWIRASTRLLRSADFVYVLCIVIALHYWVSGVEKVRLGWLGGDPVSLLLPATYAGGWALVLEPAALGRVTAALGRLDLPMAWTALLLECGALLALTSRGVIRGLIMGWIMLHAAIFPLSGILFWEWMLVHAAILIVLFGRGAPDWVIFTRPHALLAPVLIIGGALLLRPPPLAWIDAPVSYTYRATGTGASGRTYALHPGFFSPYRYQFTLGDFGYLHGEPKMAVTWGAAWDRALVDELRDAATAGDVLAIEAKRGGTQLDSERAARFERFVRRFVTHWNRRDGDRGWWSVLRPPPRLWTFPRGATPTRNDPIVRVTVEEVLSFFDGNHYAEVRSRPVRVIETAQ